MSLKTSARLAPFIFIAVAIGIYFYNKSSNKYENEITVYAHSSFISKYGPGPELAELFEKQKNIKVKFVNVGEAGLLLKKVKANSGPSDVIVGLDNLSLDRAKKNFDWLPTAEGPELIMYDWAPVTFIFKDSRYKSIRSFKDIYKFKDLKITIPDPRFSTTGLMFLYWVYALHSDEGFEQALVELKGNVHSFPSSWSASYGLFKQGTEVDMSFSYQTSLLYHWIEEGDKSYQALNFNKHIIHMEFMGVPASCSNCKGAKAFVSFMTSIEAQKIIMHKNYMLPVNSLALEGTEFESLPQLKIADINTENEFMNKKEELINVWKRIYK